MQTRHEVLRTAANLAATVALAAWSSGARAADWPQWRGPERNGVSPETGLLKEWPKDGPKLLWQAKAVGSGYATPAVAGDRVYLLGNEGLDNEFVAALAVADGQQAWRTLLGKVGNPDQRPNFPAARSTPTLDGDALYALSSDGDLACLEAATGKVRWQKNVRTAFNGKPGNWAYAESPLVDADRLICTPGGADATLVALNKQTGEVLWKCAVPGGDEAAYASAIVVEAAGVRQIVQFVQKGLVGADEKTGRWLWRYDETAQGTPAVIPSPVARGDLVYSAARGGGGLVRLQAAPGGVRAERIYYASKLPTAIGGAVLVGDCLYGATAKALLCVDFATGNVKWEDRALGAASVCCADGCLYLHGENGEVALVAATPDGYREKGRFTPADAPRHSNAMEKAWVYPVVANGRLYIRDLGLLWCYDVKAAP